MVLPLSILLLCVTTAAIVKKFLQEMGLIFIHAINPHQKKPFIYLYL